MTSDKQMTQRGNRDPFRRTFDEFSREFQRMERMMDELWSGGAAAAQSLPPTATEGETTVYGPYYYGYSMTVGPDGKPQVRQFGNFTPSGPGGLLTEGTPGGVREPEVDALVDSKKGVLRMAAEMPGVTKEDVKVSATEDSVTISAERGEKKYHAEVRLPAEIEPDSTEASYNNGVLELTAKLRAPETKKQKKNGTEIKVG